MRPSGGSMFREPTGSAKNSDEHDDHAEYEHTVGIADKVFLEVRPGGCGDWFTGLAGGEIMLLASGEGAAVLTG